MTLNDYYSRLNTSSPTLFAGKLLSMNITEFHFGTLYYIFNSNLVLIFDKNSPDENLNIFI